MSQTDSIFILCSDPKYQEQWIKEWPKIKGVFSKITSIREALKETSQPREQNVISISLVCTSRERPNKSLNRLYPMFMYTQILKEILLTIDFQPKHFQEFIDYCRDTFSENQDELKNIDKLEQEYRDETPIW
jgi:hypothetical protein